MVTRDQVIARVMDCAGPVLVDGYRYDVHIPREMAEKIVDSALADLIETTSPKVRRTDPKTSVDAASVIKAKSTTARVKLLEAFANHDVDGGITDEEACVIAGLSEKSEYATRCSELRTAGLIAFTGCTWPGRSGAHRAASAITSLGRDVLRARKENSES